MNKVALLLLSTILFAGSCKSTKKTATNSAPQPELISDETFRKPIVDKLIYNETTEVVPLDTVFVTKDTLNIITKKIWGCDAENFKLIWNGDLGKTSPPKTNVKLFQLVDGACKERHKFHLTYNISPLKLKGDTAAQKTTQIKVGGWGRIADYIHN